MVEITDQSLNLTHLMARVQSPSAGAIATFVGTVRRDGAMGRAVAAMEYEAYQGMAERVLADIETEMRGRWGIVDCVLAHRVGVLATGEASVVVAVSSAHRVEAFEACRHGIEEIKRRAPIWKKELYEDGQSAWIESIPGAAPLE